MFSHGGEEVQGQTVRLRHVHGHELDAAFHQIRDKGDGAGQAVQLGNHQHSPFLAAQGERCSELGPVVLPAAFHLHELAQKLLAGSVGCYSAALRVQPEAALTLPFRGDAIVGDEGRNRGHASRLL